MSEYVRNTIILAFSCLLKKFIYLVFCFVICWGFFFNFLFFPFSFMVFHQVYTHNSEIEIITLKIFLIVPISCHSAQNPGLFLYKGKTVCRPYFVSLARTSIALN